jgi:hypothetical protein
LAHFQALAKANHIVLPISFFEKSGPVYFNSLAMEVVDRVEIKDAIRGDVTGSGRAGG